MITTWLNYKVEEGEINKKPSQTVPDQDLPIKVFVDRFTKGLVIPKEKNAIWYKNNEVSEFEGVYDKLDKFERRDLQKKLKKDIEKKQKALEKQIEVLKEEQQKAAALQNLENKKGDTEDKKKPVFPNEPPPGSEG